MMLCVWMPLPKRMMYEGMPMVCEVMILRDGMMLREGTMLNEGMPMLCTLMIVREWVIGRE